MLFVKIFFLNDLNIVKFFNISLLDQELIIGIEGFIDNFESQYLKFFIVKEISSENFLYEFVFKYLRIYNVDLFLLLRFLKKSFYININ